MNGWELCHGVEYAKIRREHGSYSEGEHIHTGRKGDRRTDRQIDTHTQQTGRVTERNREGEENKTTSTGIILSSSYSK